MVDSTREAPKVSAKEFKALTELVAAWQALKSLGWTEPRYFQFPEDGREFELIELGSTGIHRAIRSGRYYFVDGDWPSQPFLVRALKGEG